MSKLVAPHGAGPLNPLLAAIEQRAEARERVERLEGVRPAVNSVFIGDLADAPPGTLCVLPKKDPLPDAETWATKEKSEQDILTWESDA